MKAFQAVVTGEVQGVLYRPSAQRAAREMGIVGTVQNLSDGTVEVIAEGAEVALERFLEALWKGSEYARVEDVRVEWREPLGTFKDFDILF